MKHLFIISFFFILFNYTYAASDTITVHLKNSGRIVPTRDSADFVRLIVSPDTSIDRYLYRIYEFHPNGIRKRTATSFTGNRNLVLDGVCIDFFPNGKRKSIITFSKGYPKGDFITYYPNGKLHLALKITPNLAYYSNSFNTGAFWNMDFNNYDVKLLECRDSTGRVTAVNGTGKELLYDDNFKLIAEGEIIKDRKEGEWTGLIADSGNYVIQYHKDEIKSGDSYLKSGKHYLFKKLRTNPVFSDGMDSFKLFKEKNTVYLESAKQRKITGSVHVTFFHRSQRNAFRSEGSCSWFNRIVKPGGCKSSFFITTLVTWNNLWDTNKNAGLYHNLFLSKLIISHRYQPAPGSYFSPRRHSC